MSDFKGRVKSVSSKAKNDGTAYTIVIISDDDENDVFHVEVIYPSDLDPSVDPVICDHSDDQNGNRIFNNDTLTLNSSAPGKDVILTVTMKDADNNTLGAATNFKVIIEGYNS